MSKNVSDQLVEMLVQAGVKRVYAITGDSLNPVNDAIRRDGRLEWIHVRHEESAAYAASMDAELNGIGCCMGSSGPGHVHLINGLYDANRSGNPVIAIASTCATHKFGTHWFQETNPFLLFQDCSKYVYVANTPKQFTTMMQRAIQTAINEKGVAVLGLPGDVAAVVGVEKKELNKEKGQKVAYGMVTEFPVDDSFLTAHQAGESLDGALFDGVATVSVTAYSKGKGYQGMVKRCNIK